MANRHLLAVNKLEEFKNWLIENNWKIEKTKGNYEVLRARKSTEKLPLIVYKKDKDGLIHLSVSDWNTKYVYEFINDNKSNKQTDLQTQLDHQKARIEELEGQFAYECECNKQFVQLQKMWNELKEWLKNQITDLRHIEIKTKTQSLRVNDAVNCFREVLYKMQELEGEDVED